ncbi:wsc domain-containing protein [Purpureocillium lilacinum]|uniref:Wsc domain-containing protein n=1 Tax=Purpureocillium lilacinum TaxID=33203 RepID=A0A179HQ96_PURLI|nr:wsc domain-containing protein [Purpureocillium lilacinum]OAQ92164.1 wsc domain-containing protein [Purpureocillium lilacinum]
MKAVCAVLVSALAGLARGLASTDTITWGGDNTRAGYQTNHNMDPAIVGSSQFGQLFKTKLPGAYNGNPEQIFSQPLVYTPKSGTKQYVYWATTQNNIYKLDAKTGEIVASRNLHIPFLTADLDGCVDINPTVGITATGVIDPDSETLYLTAKTYLNQNGGNGAQGRPNGRYYVHAIDINDLSEKPGFPVDLEGLIARNNPTRMFTGGIHHQRPGLLLTGGYIYAGFASHCVQYNFTGWIVGWDKQGKIVEKWATEGQGVPNTIKGGGIWMSGGGLASDDAGSIWAATGNGYASQLANVPVKGYNPPTSMEEAAIHMTQNTDGSLNLVDFFMPWEKQALDGADKDLGTSPLEILPSAFSCGDAKRIGVVTGKSGKTYWLNLDNLGGYRNGADGLDDVIQVYQNPNSVYAGAGVYPLEGGYIYINVIQYPTAVFKFSCNGGKASFAKVAESPAANAYILGVSHGTVTSLNGQPGTGLLWVTDVQGLNLKIYNAIPKDDKLVMINSFNIPGTTKFTRPVFGDGIVYVGTNQGYVYGFGSPVNVPLNCTSPVDFGNVDIANSSSSQPISCTANIDVTVTGVALDDTTNFQVSGLPTLPLQVPKGQSFTFNGLFKPTSVGFISDDILVNTTNSVAGYSTSTHARLTGTGQSSGALLGLSPNTITFKGVVTGDDPSGVSETLVVSNRGNAPLSITQVLYSSTSSTGPYTPWSGQGDLVVGKFTLKQIPTTVAANQGATVNVVFDSSTSGTFSGFVTFVTNGGNATVSIAGSSGPAASALLEFQTPDGSGWVRFDNNTAFTFGNVTENTSRSLKFRITNTAPADGVKLSLTVSKPPFGVAGLIRAANQIDLAEGTSLAPGESGNATLTCTVPKSQWNVDPYNGTATWTLNTNDPKLGKQFIQFFCNAVAEQAAPLLPNGQGQYRYVGCFQDNTPGRQLPNQLFGDDALTNAKCITACNAKGNVFCATQYHRECWAGNSIPLKKVDDVNCNFYCSGDLQQTCGGNGENELSGNTFMSLFADSLQWDGNYTKPPVTGPIVNPGVSGYSSIGCYTEATNGRALPNGAATDKKTVANCVNACKGKTYTYAGVEYGGECWCGNALGAGSVSAPDKDCSMTCNDNSTEYCGGPSRLNVYKLGGQVSSSSSSAPATSSTTATDSSTATDSTTTTSSATPTPTGPSRRQTIGKFSRQGCWTETANGRALADKNFAADTMTLESCATFCDAFTYFGVEYGRECYCGNALRAGSVKADNQEDCSFLCPGDKTEYCGAGNRLELYMLTPSNQTSSTSSSSPVDTAISATPTGIDSTTTTTTTSSSSSAAPTPTGPAIRSTVGAFAFQGCWTEATNGRALKDKTYANDSMTLESCSAFCTGFIYFGVEYGRECYCGNALQAGSVKASNQAIYACACVVYHEFSSGYQHDHFVSCTDVDLFQFDDVYDFDHFGFLYSCADHDHNLKLHEQHELQHAHHADHVDHVVRSDADHNHVFKLHEQHKLQHHKLQHHVAYLHYHNFHLHHEPSSGKLMDKQVYNNGTSMTIELCLQKCYMYKWAGVEYGRECWCGNKLNLAGNTGATPGKNVTDSQCSFLCPGDKKVYCGAGSRLQLYSNNATTI